VKAGFSNDARVARFAWLLKIRQSEGGWAIPSGSRHVELELHAVDQSSGQLQHPGLRQTDRRRKQLQLYAYTIQASASSAIKETYDPAGLA